MAIRILLSARLGERRCTQADLARATGMRPATINELYHEITERVNLEHLDLICEALDCELSELITRGQIPRARSNLVQGNRTLISKKDTANTDLRKN